MPLHAPRFQVAVEGAAVSVRSFSFTAKTVRNPFPPVLLSAAKRAFGKVQVFHSSRRMPAQFCKVTATDFQSGQQPGQQQIKTVVLK